MKLRKAERKRVNLRIALMGPSGSGKSYTMLRMCAAICKRIGVERFAVIGTESSGQDGDSIELYAGRENPDGGTFDFDLIDLNNEPGKYSVENYLKALAILKAAGYKVIGIDSMSHAWAGEGGVLAFVDKAAAKSTNKNSYAAWREGTPLQQKFTNELMSYPGHVVGTMRVKTEYTLEEDNRGKKVPKKIGLAPVQRDGIEYEFTLTADIDQDTHRLTVAKTRIDSLDGYSEVKAGAKLADHIVDWLLSAEEAQPKVDEPKPEPNQGVISRELDGGGGEPDPEPGSDEDEDTIAREVDAKRESFRKAFFKQWNAIFKAPTQKEGLTKEDVDKAKLEQENLRALVVKAWFKVDSLNAVPVEKLGEYETYLRTVKPDVFKAKVDKVINPQAEAK